MARLAEASVAIALRDWQWKRGLAVGQFPDRYLALTGKAEKWLGDAAIQHDERLFLFELKSRHSNFADEWIPVTLKNGTTRPRKAAHRWAKRLASELIKGSFALPRSKERRMLVRSLRAHHFLYWSPTLKHGTSASGHLMLQPYFLATLRQCDTIPWRRLRRHWQGAFDLGYSLSLEPGDPQDAIRYGISKALPLDALYQQRGRLMELVDPTATTYTWQHLGLRLTEFQQYVRSLCSKLKTPAQINAVVMSSRGSFFAQLTSTDQLENIFSAPLPGERIQTFYRRNPQATLPPMAHRFSPNHPSGPGVP